MPLHGDYAPSSSERTRRQVEEFEASDGARANTLRGVPVIVLTSVGAKSGKLRKNALMRVEHDGRYAVVASQGGAPRHPRWYHNLVANPLVALPDGPRKLEYIAHEAAGREKCEWWARATEVWPNYDAYQRRTSREIPLFVMTPVESAESAAADEREAS